MIVRTFSVPAKGIGRKDYTEAAEYFVEPLITSWQGVYMMTQAVMVPAASTVDTDIAIVTGRVIYIYDFFATITENRLINLTVSAVDALGTVVPVVNMTRYQTVVAHVSKGHSFFNTMRFSVQNYGSVQQTVEIGAAGMVTSLSEFFMEVAPTVPNL